MTATTTVDTTATTVEATVVDTSVTEVKAEVTTGQSAIELINKLASANKGNYIGLCSATGELARQPLKASTFLEMAEIMATLQATGQLELKFGVTDTEAKAYASISRHFYAASAVQAIDASHHGMRLSTLGDSDGFGLYAEAGPLGHAGIGLGVVSRETTDGVTTVKHTGAGLYVRADHLTEKGKLVQSFA